MCVELIKNGPTDGPVYVFAHGAGANMNSEFMTQVAVGLAERGIHVVRFNFPYMIKREEDGKRRPPDRAPKLLEAYKTVIKQLIDGLTQFISLLFSSVIDWM